MNGRPLRFLGMVLLLWVTLRVVAWWPATAPQGPLVAGLTDPPGVATPFPSLHLAVVNRRTPALQPAARTSYRPVRAAVSSSATAAMPGDLAVETPILKRVEWPPTLPRSGESPVAPAVAFPALPLPVRSPDRWTLSIWAIGRDGRSDMLATGQLGASQLGARATYTVDGAARVAVTTRLSTPIGGKGREAALGIDWQPIDAPVHLIAEQRLPLDGGTAQPAAFATAGFDRAVSGVRIEGYGQAGGVLRRGLFADGAARVTTPVARLHIGIGIWGGAQRDAARLDVGPTAAIVLPVADRGVRLTLDWRHRIAGDARPGSGPALSIGGDF